jgi:hypothetical protein
LGAKIVEMVTGRFHSRANIKYGARAAAANGGSRVGKPVGSAASAAGRQAATELEAALEQLAQSVEHFHHYA